MTFYSFTQGLTSIGRNEYLSEWIPVAPGQKLLTYSASDIIVNVYCEFNHEPNEPVSDYRLAYQKVCVLNRQFKSDTVRSLSRYIRFRFTNNSGSENHHLEFYVYAYQTPTKSEAPVVVENPLPVSPSSELTPRGSTPIKERRLSRGFFSKKEEGKVEMKSNLDYRMPQFIPKNSLLVGAHNGRVTTLAPGLLNQVLKYTDEGPMWCFEYPPRG